MKRTTTKRMLLGIANRWRVAAAVLFFGLMGIVALQISNAATEEPEIAAQKLAAERIIVKFRDDVVSAQSADTFKAAGAVQVASMDNLPIKVVEVPKDDRERVLAELRADPRVTYAEPDTVRKPRLTTPNDPEYATWQWSWPQTLTDLMWDKAKGSDAFTVAVIDSGVNAAHPDLAGKIIAGKDFVNNDNDPKDDNGHGTLIASIIAANSNNGTGVAGACWNCKVLAVKVSNSEAINLVSHGIGGIDYAISKGVKLINLSFGGEGYTTAEKDIIDLAVSKGILVVGATANEPIDAKNDWPSSLANVIGVSASDTVDSLTSYSAYGSVIDIAAPGTAVGASHSGPGYVTMHGTSFATPTVAGIAAAIWSAFPNATHTQIRDALISTADPCCAGRISGGRINAMKAYNKMAGITTDITKPTVSIGSPTEGLSVGGEFVPVTASATDNAGVAKVHIQVDNTIPAVRSRTPAVAYWNLKKFGDKPYTARVTAYDTSGNSTIVTRPFIGNSTTPADTVNPVIAMQEPAEGAVMSGTASPIRATVTDNVLVAAVEVRVDDKPVVLKLAPPFSWTLDTTKFSNGAHIISILADDSSGRLVSTKRNVTINNTATPPPPPPTNPPSPPPTNPPNPPNPTPKPGDLNNDGKVNITDLSTLLSNWGKSGVPADINGSGKVDIADLSTLLSNWTR